ncbi:uncharacterized protein LOC120354019 [Nilaparvata lugens]|uniref:uncharacterized protein LOC120354019 n=1 Tax=Nilaparvata lugens TaxID=108931 RepID=UPI00193C9BF4|nr:uncharacterized protein LOC120354019 [Nilaparvata lugens]XP_039295764.1 uncharacterized protein LOC120354019 [Nilaparvata lugens]
MRSFFGLHKFQTLLYQFWLSGLNSRGLTPLITDITAEGSFSCIPSDDCSTEQADGTTASGNNGGGEPPHLHNWRDQEAPPRTSSNHAGLVVHIPATFVNNYKTVRRFL